MTKQKNFVKRYTEKIRNGRKNCRKKGRRPQASKNRRRYVILSEEGK